jgi:hypothetical protein
MDARARRIGKNEALFRTVNEEAERVNQGLAALSDQVLHVVCECGDLTCAQTLPVSAAKYEEVRSDAALFLIAPGHKAQDVEDIVESAQAFDVVRKRPGEPERLAQETNPRST